MTFEEWVSRETISFSMDDAVTLNAAMDRLIAACGPSLEILGLGEPTHLVNDYLRLRNRIFQALVQRHGFSAIAIESSFTRGPIVDDLLSGRTGSIDDAIQRGITHNMSQMPANRELLEWLRRYNSEAPAAKQIRFYGCDSPTEMMYADSPRQLLSAALEYFENGTERLQRIESLIGNDADWENTAAMMDPTKSIGRSDSANALRVATEDLIAELAALQPQGMSSDPSAYRRAMRCAIHARQILAYHALCARPSPTRIADMLGLRDVMMADNLRYAAEQEKSRGKLFAFAHNSHLKRGQAVWQWGPDRLAWWPAGAHLAATMHEKYAVIGIGVGQSKASDLAQPEPGTLENHLLATPGPVRVAPTHLGRSLNAPNLKTRTANPRFFPLGPESLTDFDFLAVLDTAE